MQRELRRFADRAGKQQQRNAGRHTDAQRIGGAADSRQKLGVENLPLAGAEIERAGLRPQIGQADHKQHIAHAGGDKRFDRRLARRDLAWVGVDLVVPEANQQVRAQAHQLPGHEEQQQVAGEHHQQHRSGEQRDKREEARLALVVRHIAQREQVDAGRGDRHHHQHRRCSRVDIVAHGERGIAAGRRPAECADDVRRRECETPPSAPRPRAPRRPPAHQPATPSATTSTPASAQSPASR